VRETALRLLVAAARFARAEAALVGALIIVSLGAWGFAGIAEELLEDESIAFDRFVLDALRTPGGDPSDPIGPHWLDIAMTDLTALGSIAVLLTVALVVSGFLLIQRRAISVMFIVTALGGGMLASSLLKVLFGRERPPDEFRAVEVINASFPSGHAMLSAVAYLTIGAMVARSQPKRRLKVYVMSIAVLLTFVVGFSRIYLGVHWASDVVGGWCVGAAWAGACWVSAWAFERFFGRAGVSRPQHMPPAPAGAAAGE